MNSAYKPFLFMEIVVGFAPTLFLGASHLVGK